MNSLFVISPYWLNGTWVFDDEARGLKAEPFVLGIPEIINNIKEKKNITNNFKIVFSAVQFPKYDFKIDWIREEDGGNWYSFNNNGNIMEGWLCPALFKFFDAAPKTIYFMFEASGGMPNGK